MKLTSSAFSHGDEIPPKYGYKNENVSPPLTIEEVPEGTESLALIMDDPDAMNVVADGKKPYSEPYVHWVVYNIVPFTPFPKAGQDMKWRTIHESSQGSIAPLTVDEWRKPNCQRTQRFHEFSQDAYGVTFMFGANDFGKFAYGGPAPPNPHEPRFAGSPERHTYVFKVYALDIGGLNFYKAKTDNPVTKADVEREMEGHIIEQTTLTGTYAP